MRNTNILRAIILIIIMTAGPASTGSASVQDVELIDITPKALLSHSAIDLVLQGDILLTLGAGNRLLNIYDIRDVINPRRVTALELPAKGSMVALGRDAAYVTCPGHGLVVADLGNPLVPKVSEVYEFQLGSSAVVMVQDGYLYLHDGQTTLRSFELTRPWELKEICTLNIPGGGDMVAIGDMIYFASAGIQAVDTADPHELRHIGEYAGIRGSIWGMAASADFICAIDDTDTLTLLRPVDGVGVLEEVSSVDVGNVMLDVAISGTIVAAATADNFITFDISKPGEPVLHGNLPLVCELREIKARGNLFFLASELDGPLVVDVTNPLRQRVVAYQAGLGLVSTIASRGSLMLAGSWDSIRALERREEGDVEIVGIQHSEGFTREMQITGDFAYLADPGRGLRVFNVSRPVFMRPVALLELPGTPSDVELVGDLAFIPLGDEGVAQANIHYPFDPVLRKIIETEHPCTNVARKGDYLYFIGPDGYVGIYDITLPTQPRQAAWLDLSGLHPIDAMVHDDLMAVSAGTDGLWLFNVADPLAPVLRSKYIADGSVETAALFDGGAILEVKGPGFSKLEVIDLRHVFAPYKRTELGLKERSDYRDKLHVVGDRAYLAAYNYGMKVVEMRGLLD
jgi:hypothetical protein